MAEGKRPYPIVPKELMPKKRAKKAAPAKKAPGPEPRQRQSMIVAKRAFVERIKLGASIPDALAAAGRSSYSTYEDWRKKDPDFARRIDEIRQGLRTGAKSRHSIEFEDFCRDFLGQPLFRHQLQWVDLLEGRGPRGLHPSQIYEPGDPCFIMVNTPPEHAKSTTISVNYVTYRVVTDPNVKIMIVSKTADRAKEFLYAIKQRLTHPRYEKLQAAFGPPGGWKESATVWAADQIYFGAERDSSEKDPTIQAVGIGGQIYGARSDLIILDDGVVLSNAHQFEAQARWIQQEVITRLGPVGKLLVVGTRVDAMDLYKALREPERYPDGHSPWTYLSQPAVLEYGDDPSRWVTLWPRADVPWSPAEKRGEDGLYARWDGQNLARRRGMLNPRTWANAYMQAEIADDCIFDPLKVRACVNGMRQPGLMRPGQPNVRAKGMQGLYVIASMDPAMVGDTAVIVYAVDRFAKKRYVVDVRLRTSATPAWIRETIKEVTEVYDVADWRIEKNAFQQFLTQDPDLNEWLASRGVRLMEHHTGRNKWDAGFGVASMSVLFDMGLIELPSTHLHEPTKQFVEQLVTWSPETKGKTDLVMALWFAEIRAREVCQVGSLEGDESTRGFVPNRFLSKRQRAKQTIVNLNDLAVAQRGR